MRQRGRARRDRVAGVPALWTTDGTPANTKRVRSIAYNMYDNISPKMVTAFDRLIIAAPARDYFQLWTSDGTSAGCQKIFTFGDYYTTPTFFVGDLLLFVANDQIHGAELFRSDGTEDGTVLVRDIREGAGGACGYSSNLAALPEGLGVAFPAFTEDYGIELWVSDGSARNTCRVTDAVEGTGSLLFSWMTLAGDRLFLSADDGVRGYEPWMVKTSDLGRVIEIDVKPGGGDNPINRKSRGSIPVAILSTDDFDAPAEVDPDSLTFGHTGFEESLVRVSRGEKDGDHDDGHDTPYGEDVDGDGDLDLVCHFATDKTDFDKKDTQGILRGHTKDGAILRGADKVCIVK
jgi:ELWxxDGT repeat protein